jgi:drug/metabolite transporter (DMT)-like permease
VISTARGTRAGAFGWADWGLLCVVAGFLGASYPLMAEGLESFAPPLVTLIRLVLGTATLAAFRGGRARIARADWPRVVLLAVVWMAVPFLLIPTAQQWLDSGIVGMINGAMPLFTGVLAAILLRRLPGLLQILGLLVGFGGVALVAWPAAAGGSGSPLGVAMVMAAVMCFALAVNLAVPLQQAYGAVPVLLRAEAVATVLVAPIGIAAIPHSSWSWSSAVATVVLGVAATGFALLAMAVLAGRVGATRASVAIYFLPVVAAVLGVTVRKEHLPGLAFGGLALILVGAWLISRRDG